MRATTLLREILNLKDTRIVDLKFVAGGIVVDAAPRWRAPRCSGCGRKRRGYDTNPSRLWRHLDLAGMKLWLGYEIRRVDCKQCGVVVETVPWRRLAPGSPMSSRT